MGKTTNAKTKHTIEYDNKDWDCLEKYCTYTPGETKTKVIGECLKKFLKEKAPEVLEAMEKHKEVIRSRIES